MLQNKLLYSFIGSVNVLPVTALEPVPAPFNSDQFPWHPPLP